MASASGGFFAGTARSTSRWRAAVVMVASGFAALGYQIVWTQEASLWLGHEAAGVFAVVGAFFGGLAIGAFALGARIERSAAPWKWYAACELVIAAWGVALALLLDPATQSMLAWIGPFPSPLRHWSAAFLGTLLLLLPATAAMGATLPAMENMLGRRHDHGQSIAVLYAANTAGAVLGVLAAAFVLVPALGLLRTGLICGALNVVCAALALGLRGQPRTASASSAASARSALISLFFTGLLGIGYEVLVVRVLTQVTQNTVYTFAILLAVYLVGTAAGAAAYVRWVSGKVDTGAQRTGLLVALALTCALGTAGLSVAPTVYGDAARWLGAGMGGALGAEAAVAAWAFLLPCLLMGALFSLLAGAARQSGAGFGTALGINTLGAALAPAVFGVLIAPAISAKPALMLVAAGYLALIPPAAWLRTIPWLGVASVAVLASISPSLVIVDMPPGGRLLSHVQGKLSTVSVIESAEGVATLHIDNRQQEGSNVTFLADARQGVLPLLLHPAPKRALFLGLGTGVTATAAARERGLDVDAVELLPEVITASGYFTAALDRRLPGPAPRLVNADARRFVRSGTEPYDVIVSDNFHPARSGSAALYTVEHFAAVRARLSEGGVFCQWLPLHQMDLDSLRSIVASFLAVYPKGWALLATNSLETPVVGLIARKDGERLDLQQVRQRLERAEFPGGAATFGVTDEFALLGSFVAGPDALSRFAAGTARNTDDHPVVAYRAPRITYVPDSRPAERLLSLVGSVRIDPRELLESTDAEAKAPAERLARYWEARNRFLAVGTGVQPSGDVRRMLEQVREPLLSLVRLSPEFRPAYDPLLRMADAMSGIDPAEARALLRSLRDAAPQRSDAAAALRELQDDRGR